MFFCINVYGNSVEIFSDINAKENSLDITEAIFSPDTQYLVYSFGKSNVYFYDINEAAISFQINFEKSIIIRRVEYSPDGQLLAIITSNTAAYTDCSMFVYDTTNFDLLYEKKIFYYQPSRKSTLFSKDSKYIIVCYRDFNKPLHESFHNPKDITLDFLDSKTGTIIRKIPSKALINNCIISNDNNKILISYAFDLSGTINWFLWNITETTVHETEIPQPYTNLLRFSEDSKFIYSENKVWNAENGIYIKSFTSNIFSFMQEIVNVDEFIILGNMFGNTGFTRIPSRNNFLEDVFLDKYCFFSSDDYEQTNIADTSVLKSVGEVHFGNLSNDCKYMCFTCTDEGSVFLCHTNWQMNKQNTEKPICKISVFENDEWIALTPDGFYNSSLNGDKYLHIRYNLDVYDLKQFTKAYFQPDVLISIAQGKTDPKCVSYYGDILLSSPPPLISVEQKEIRENCLPINLRVLNYGNKSITDISFYRNGKYLGNNRTEFKNYITSEKTDSVEMDISLMLENGKNYIEVVANTDICYGIHTIELEVEGIEKNNSDLYILSIGINKYLQSEQSQRIDYISNLSHAVEDSKDITSTIKKKLANYKTIHITQINDEAEIKPTKDKILESLSMFEKMTENDDAIIYIAAHGVTNNGTFYIIPNDYKVNNSSKIVDFSSAIDIEEILRKLNCLGRKIVLLDTCMSGGIQNNYSVKTLQNKSIALLAAAQANELALESVNAGGIFTQSVIFYFNSQNPESYNLNMMAKFIYNAVRDMSRIEKRGRIKQNPFCSIPEGFSNFSF